MVLRITARRAWLTYDQRPTTKCHDPPDRQPCVAVWASLPSERPEHQQNPIRYFGGMPRGRWNEPPRLVGSIVHQPIGAHWISDRRCLSGTFSVIRWVLLSNASPTCLLLLVRFHVQDGTDEMIEARVRGLVEQPSRQSCGHIATNRHGIRITLSAGQQGHSSTNTRRAPTRLAICRYGKGVTRTFIEGEMKSQSTLGQIKPCIAALNWSALSVF